MNKIRHLYIKAIATSDFKKHYKENWQKTIERTIRNCSKVYEKEFGIKLVLKEIKIRKYKPMAFVPYYFFDYVMNFVNETSSNNFDTTVAFTNAPFFWDGSDGLYSTKNTGVIMYASKLILLANPEKTKNWIDRYKNIDSSFLKFTLLHELGHFFGAKDVKNKKSYMHEAASFKGRYFNKTNKKIILKNKWKKFQ